MRLAVVSDIHSNLAALDAVLDDLPEVEQIWALGDIVGYGPQPNEVIARLRERDVRAVLGNHDGAAIGTVDTSWFNVDAATAVHWTATVIDEPSRAWLASLPMRRTEGELTAVHGSPRDPIWEYVASPGVARANLAEFGTRWCLCGHTHLPVIYHANRDRMAVVEAIPGRPITLNASRAILNPGSVGQPRDGNPDASYLVFDTESRRAEYRRVAYDIARTQGLMREVDLPGRLVDRLAWGR
jgi:predicted phosphodiesterase